jgi:predicted PurR-regulated permease PerM
LRRRRPPQQRENHGYFLQLNSDLIVIRRPVASGFGAQRLGLEMVVELIRSVGKRRFPLIVRDAQPLEKFEGMWRVGAQVAVIGLFFFACIAALEFARPILLPIVSAFMLGMMLGPLSSLGERMRIPPILTAVFLWLLVIAIFYGIVMLLSAPLIEWAGKGSELGQIIKGKLSVLDRPIAMVQDLRTALFPRAKDQPEVAFNFLSVMQPAVLFVTPAIGQMVIFLGTLFFFLIGRTQLRQVMVVFFKKREARLRMLRILNDVEHNLTSYLTLVTLINAVVGVIAFAITYAVGLPSPIVWGVLAFLLNFVPYLGALLMEAILLLAGLVVFPTLGQAVIAPLVYLAFTTLEGHFVTPTIMGKHLLLNPLTVFLALVFWTWLWGPIGALLAVPLLIVSLIAINHLFPKEEAALPE